MMNFFTNNIEFVLFIVFLSVFLFFKRKRLEIQGSPLLYMMLYKTTWGLSQMKSWSSKHPRVFHYFGRLSYFIGVYGMVIMIFLSMWSLYIIFDQNLSTGGGLVLPIQTGDTGANGISEGAVPIFYVPFWYWIIALFILATVHEFAHGVVAQRYKIPVKSSGFAFLGVFVPLLPAAFVEPDDKVMKKKSRYEQIAVLGAGSTSNFVFGILFLLIWIFVTAPFVSTTTQVGDISFSSVMNESSLNNYNITQGKLLSFNGVSNSQEILNTQLSNLSANETYEVVVLNQDNQTITTNITTFLASDSSRALVGISGLSYSYSNVEGYEWLGNFPILLHELLLYIWLLNIGIGMMNLLPLWITDGGRICLLLLESKLSKEKASKWYMGISFFVLGLIIVSIWPSLLNPFLF